MLVILEGLRVNLTDLDVLGLPTPSSTPTSAPVFKCAKDKYCGSPCDFTKDMCNWINSNLDNFDWTRHRGCTASISTGPCTDADKNPSGQFNNSYDS